MNDKQNSEALAHGDNFGKRILIFDDDQEILIMCKIILKKFNYQVMTLSRCENVITDIESFKPDLILMDLWIPEIGGEKAVQLAKANPHTRHIPILLFSANSDISEICIRAKADGYITKPFKLNVFKEAIEYHIQISQPNRLI